MQQKARINIKWYLWSIAVGIASIIGLLSYWNFSNPTVIKFNGDYKTEKTIYSKGEETFYTVDYCKLLNSPVIDITKEFVDTLVFEVDSPQATLSTGCRIQEVHLKIPSTLPEGTFRLRITVTYQVNPIKTVTYVHYSNWFKVILDPVTHLDAEQDIE